MASRLIFAEPWVGEFGWELMHWAPLLRRLSRDHDVAVCAPSGSRILYKDFCVQFHPHNLYSENCSGHDPRNSLVKAEASRLADLLCLENGYVHRIAPSGNPGAEREFIELGRETPRKTVYDVVLHPRVRACRSYANYRVPYWIDLIKRLSDLNVAVIKAPQTYRLPCSCREVKIESVAEAVSLLRTCSLFVGPDSGTLHLAGLCGTPRLTWLCDYYNRNFRVMQSERLTGLWNPLGASTVFASLSSFQPVPDLLERRIREVLSGRVHH